MQKQGICQSCGNFTILVDHHWLTNGIEYHVDICNRCNGKLIPSNFGLKNDHNLPDWETQKKYIAQRIVLESQPKRFTKRQPISKGLPIANTRIPLTKTTYNTITFLKNRIRFSYTYDDITNDLIKCYAKLHKINITQEAVDKFIKEHTLEAKE